MKRPTELQQPDNHQPSQSSICTAQVVLKSLKCLIHIPSRRSVCAIRDSVYAIRIPDGTFLVACEARVRMRKPLSMGSFLMERIFRLTPNRVLIAHTEWLPGVRLMYSTCAGVLSSISGDYWPFHMVE